MKYLILLILLISFSAKAQTIKEYKASNSVTYSPGDTVKVGMGSAQNGRFTYIDMSPAMTMLTSGVNDRGAIKELANTALVIKKIKSYSGNGITKTYFYTEKGFTISIEEAILKCEVIPCKTQ